MKKTDPKWAEIVHLAKKRRATGEAYFEREIARNAPLFGMRYYKIPDTKMLNKYNRKQNQEEKRPFDGPLITKKFNYMVECKFGNNKLMPHQAVNRHDINEINKSFLVLTKKKLTKKFVYICETWNSINKFDDVISMLKFIDNLK